jgi:hypothetical protein
MNKLEWRAKLLEWVESDPRLKGLPYVHIGALEEHLAESMLIMYLVLLDGYPKAAYPRKVQAEVYASGFSKPCEIVKVSVVVRI